MLEQHKARKEAVCVQMRQLAQVADALGMRSLRVDIEGVRLPKLDEERFNLVVLGEFNHGKSTFVNALLGEPILPVGITPTTATINHIVWGEAPHARAVLRDGGTKEINPKDLAEYVTLEGEHTETIRFVELAYPAELLRERITLVDTPGVNDINEARAEITYSYIPRADAVIFLLDATQVLKQSERTFIQQRLLRRSRDKLLFVLGKIDLLDDEEREQALAFAEEHLAQIVTEPQVFALSAKRQLEGKSAEAGMAPMLAHLQRFLSEERGRILLDNAIDDAQRTVRYLRSSIGIKRGSLQLSEEQLTERILEVKKQLAGSKESLDELNQRILNEGEAVKATVRHDLRQFIAHFCEVLPAQIDKANAADVKRYLQFFIQDKLKEWAELEGDKIAEMLEHLTEEIIQVANENVHAVLDVVAGSLGAEDAKVDLQVDTLKYDAGVFILGALGTTVFLFVNTFVGGLLTLAVPLLAVVMREKVGGQIKAQAKKQAPAAIARAGEAVQPRFEEIVDRFTERLRDFIANAGQTLHRGISEVLDEALAHRKEQTESDEELLMQLDARQEELAQIDTTLEELRVQLWQSDAS
ncbi:MAG: dynamin family protein [Deltaproteobacteria bacterium]|nr:dynamin family protein [Deltaproteobacteria bacterium]